MTWEANLFSAPTPARAIQVFKPVSARVKNLGRSFYPLFEQSDISAQKIIALIALMQSDSQFIDFMYEVYRS